MPLNAGDTGYDSVPGPGLSGSMGASESTPLLIPEPESEQIHRWQPLSREELEMVAGGPGWGKVRCYLVLLFWLSWVALLATSIAIIVMSPRPVATPLRWWQKSLFYQTDLLMEAKTEGPGDVSGEGKKDVSDNINLQCSYASEWFQHDNVGRLTQSISQSCLGNMSHLAPHLHFFPLALFLCQEMQIDCGTLFKHMNSRT